MSAEWPTVPEDYDTAWNTPENVIVDPASLSDSQREALSSMHEHLWYDDVPEALRQARRIGETVVHYAVSGNPVHIWREQGYAVPDGLPRAESLGINMAATAYQLHPEHHVVDGLVRYGLQAVSISTTEGPLLVRRTVNGALTSVWYTPRSLDMS